MAPMKIAQFLLIKIRLEPRECLIGNCSRPTIPYVRSMVTVQTLDETLSEGLARRQRRTTGGVLFRTLEGSDEAGNEADHCVVSPRGEQLL